MSNIFENGYALSIGIGADLPVTIKDATAIYELLTDRTRCAYDKNNVKLLTEYEATRDAILDALDWIASKSTANSTVVLYFSGHGIQNPNYYLLPFGYNISKLSETAISESEFSNKIKSINSKKLVVILDCCHAGGQAQVKGWNNSPLPEELLIEFKKSRGRVVLASSRKDEVSYTGTPYSVFTTALLEGFSGYGAFELDGYARILDITLWLSRKVPDRTEDKQHPIIKVNNLEDNFAICWYAAGKKTQSPLTWVSSNPIYTTKEDIERTQSYQYRLKNYSENLRLIEERLSDYIDYTDVPLQLLKAKKQTERNIKQLEIELAAYRIGEE
ncbi:MAG: caspase family protein [Candidatus Parabeggiatoa sp. nov. 3]|nr:MAG: caspase family protein [Gammaproteobacteria bacterium]RKZ66821.1 MAG: caspase family protein [Gammaproteobacteria bacterium]RKZ89165.1 MAG: caspase family protein [Gammaproteobacteria bacterium]